MEAEVKKAHTTAYSGVSILQANKKIASNSDMSTERIMSITIGKDPVRCILDV